jgi:hypothetical protein
MALVSPKVPPIISRKGIDLLPNSILVSKSQVIRFTIYFPLGNTTFSARVLNVLTMAAGSAAL